MECLNKWEQQEEAESPLLPDFRVGERPVGQESEDLAGDFGKVGPTTLNSFSVA